MEILPIMYTEAILNHVAAVVIGDATAALVELKSEGSGTLCILRDYNDVTKVLYRALRKDNLKVQATGASMWLNVREEPGPIQVTPLRTWVVEGDLSIRNLLR